MMIDWKAIEESALHELDVDFLEIHISNKSVYIAMLSAIQRGSILTEAFTSRKLRICQVFEERSLVGDS